MSAPSLILNIISFLTLFITWVAHGVNIQFLRDEIGLVWESNSTAGCVNVPRRKSFHLHAIKTDTCFIAYSLLNCTNYWSEKYMPGDTRLSDELQLGNKINIRSVQTCNEEEGGNQLNVDITEHYDYFSIVPPNILASYKKVCSCVNVPQYIQNMSAWSINNHHNDLLAYSELDCSENIRNSTLIAAGYNWDSRNMHEFTDSVTNTTYKIQSFGPDPDSSYFQTSCKYAKVLTEMHESSRGEGELDGNGIRFQALTIHLVELKTQFDQLKEDQGKFQSQMRKELKEEFERLTELITLLQLQFQMISEKN